MDVWIAIDTKTFRIVGIGTQSQARNKANIHEKLSGNNTLIRTLKIGMQITLG